MRMLSKLIFAAFLAINFSVATAQTVDLGRGELPLVVPSDYSDDKAAALVVLLHGYTSSGTGQESYFKIGVLADEYGFLFVAPNGDKEASGDQNRFWNASKACCNFQRSEVDDSAYVLAIIDDIKSRYNIDDKRVYLIGHSNGGFMSYRAAYDHSGTIAAIVSLAGAASTADLPPPPNSVHILQIHGTDDSTIAYAGDQIVGNVYPGAVESVERWAAYNGCDVERIKGGRIDLEATLDGDETNVIHYAKGCRAGGSSELWTIEGGSHIPAVSDGFNRRVIEWLMAHPK